MTWFDIWLLFLFIGVGLLFFALTIIGLYKRHVARQIYWLDIDLNASQRLRLILALNINDEHDLVEKEVRAKQKRLKSKRDYLDMCLRKYGDKP